MSVKFCTGTLVIRDSALFLCHVKTVNAIPKANAAIENMISMDKFDLIEGVEELLNNVNWLQLCVQLKSTTRTQIFFGVRFLIKCILCNSITISKRKAQLFEVVKFF